MITVYKLNESFLKIECEPDVAMELSETFSFLVPGYKYMPAYKTGRFDGYIRLLNLGRRTLQVGLYQKLKEFADQRGYELSCKDSEFGMPDQTAGITYEETEAYIKTLGFDSRPNPIEIRDYQIEGVHIWLNNYRAIAVASVGAGKSAIIGITCRYITEVLNQRTLIIVPTIGLTSQMRGDFDDYFAHTGWNASDNCHLITAGVDKNIDKPIVISTFQSIYKLSSDWFNQFGAILLDEGHKATANTIAGIFDKATKVKYKLACTGTLHDMKCNVLQMIGLTGSVYEIAPTATLIKNGQLVPLKIKSLVLNYPPEICKAMKKVEYDSEIKYITTNSKRNNFIAKLTINCSGTVLVLFRFIDQGQAVYNRIKELIGESRIVYFIDGSVSGSNREDIRLSANEDDNVIIVASYPTMATGINLPAIETIIFAHPTKSKITSLQSIGRGLRLKEGKDKCTLFDISDNFTVGKHINHTMRHLGERLKMYTQAGFTFTMTQIPF